MARVTKEVVFEAASKLAAQGKDASVLAIRDELGYGSFSTLGKWFKEWRNDQQTESVALPDAVQTIYQRSIAAIWTEAERLNREKQERWISEFARERESYAKQADEEIARLEKANQELEKNNKGLTEKNTALLREAATAEANAKTAAREAENLATKLAALDAEHRALIKQVGSLEQEVKSLKKPAGAAETKEKAAGRVSKKTIDAAKA